MENVVKNITTFVVFLETENIMKFLRQSKEIIFNIPMRLAGSSDLFFVIIALLGITRTISLASLLEIF